ncbi:hypothetical protein PR002_g19385 [Phytophthora rubi]|uniref:Uncharacterized protein n=1 Tax=Phytophthora rubi TaxID=129364 RepID=A0A6A3JMC5_9STRA|nr:hypothetical protein PR002_g19385 [Phytophthora rubi]
MQAMSTDRASSAAWGTTPCSRPSSSCYPHPVQVKLPWDVHAVFGQSVRHELVIKGDVGSLTEAEAAKRRVMCFTPMQHRGLVQFRPGQVFALVP